MMSYVKYVFLNIYQNKHKKGEKIEKATRKPEPPEPVVD